MRDGNPNSGATDNNVPCLYINNNDANLQQVYTLTTGSSGSQVYAVKVRGNTDYNNGGNVNYEYDIYFYENNPGKIDVVVNQEPTNWNQYFNNAGQVLWGVSDGTNWVDGLPYHGSSVGAGLTPVGLYTPVGTAVTLSGTYPSVVYEMGNAPTSLSIPDLSGNNLTFTEYNGESWNSNYYNFNSNRYAESDNTSFLDGITDQLTITGWFAFSSALSGSNTLVSRGANWAFRIDNDGSTLNLVKYNVADQQLSTPGGNFNTNTWHFITVSQSGGNLTFGVNGVYTSTNSGDTSNFSGTGQPVRIARDGYINTYTNMAAREIKIFSTALSESDITAIYNTEKSAYGF
jgi:hypothetical protein